MQAAKLLSAVLVYASCNTTGLFDDVWHSGNRPVISNPESLLTAKGIATDTIHGGVTEITRASDHKSSPNCYYFVTNICIKDGYPVVVRQNRNEKDGHFRVCNDLRRKVKVRYLTITKEEKSRYEVVMRSKPLFVAACWQQYGYHLWLCIMSMFYTHYINNMNRGDVYIWNHAASMERTTASHYSMADYFGSPTTWYDPHHPNADQLHYKDSHFWPLWAAIATDPGSVMKLFRPPQHISRGGILTCYDNGIIGMTSPLSIPVDSKRLFSMRVVQLHAPELWPLERSCDSTRNMLIVLRKQGGGLRTISNPTTIVEAAANFGIKTNIVSFEELPFVDQVKAAATTDIFISSHGGGNTWLAVMPPHSVFIECWLDYPRRLVYHQLASDLNIRYMTISQGVDGTAFLSKSVLVDKSQVENAIRNSLSYLNATRCCS
eukprot:TRINITY_DN16675_c0_g1_i1.p1 TRINITY_DN16675_c0_g1~~TRINITY_DN16675_c0_g1_i1.p1  ORF type:complete len:456 (+),score=65.21 TRINITY_DN16675_c0_g1_i1:71-1369(+)